MGFLHPKIKIKEKFQAENKTYQDKNLKISSLRPGETGQHC